MIITFILAVGLLFIGHYFKMLRWKQFIEIYEKPQKKILLESLGLGYILNFILPFHCGDVIRVVITGRKLKNKYGLSVATVLLDRYLDVIMVGVLFFAFHFAGFHNIVTISTLLYYSGLSILLVLLTTIFSKYRRIPKRILFFVSSLFNEKIELCLLNFSWTLISTFKMFFTKISMKKTLCNTGLMWLSYLASYYLIAKCVTQLGVEYSVVDIFMFLFSKEGIKSSFLALTFKNTIVSIFNIVMLIYIFLPLVMMFIVSACMKSGVAVPQVLRSIVEDEYLQLLPFVNQDDRLKFLELYFSGDDIQRNYLKNYMQINNNVSIIKDFSAGSNATTLLCMNQNTTFYRKFSFGSDSEKLDHQIQWLREHKNVLPLTPVVESETTKEYCYYDMPYNSNAVDFFNYIHSAPIEECESILYRILETLKSNLYIGTIKVSEDSIKKYIETKVLDNLNKLLKAKYIKDLMEYDDIIINGKKYHNLNFFQKYLNIDYLKKIFENDVTSEIHGDLTIENIIILLGEKDFYLIDPNTESVYNTENLDYSKMLQSLHGGYEFLMKVNKVSISENQIEFQCIKSIAYEKMYAVFMKYMSDNFTEDKIKAIFWHEVVHWLRLMPYKIRKDSEKAVIFYAGLLIVINDVAEKYEEIEDL